MGGMDVSLLDQRPAPPEEFMLRTEQVIKQTVAGDGGVVRGRAGAVVLRDLPHALHARLDGLVERRLRRRPCGHGRERPRLTVFGPPPPW
jgi:cytidylate kinase-like protein